MHRRLFQSFGTGYYCCELKPEKYPHAQCLKLTVADGLSVFPSEYFDLIVHNHLLEQIPGNYQEHLDTFFRLLCPNGHMIFTVSEISKTSSVQYGENLASDKERIRIYGQANRYKKFGSDFLDYMREFPGNFSQIHIPRDVRLKLKAPTDTIFVYEKI
jgi:phosphoglycolate phosphatase